MRNLKRNAAVLCLVLAVACAGVPPQRVALNSLQGIRDSVTTAVQVFNVGYQSGQFTEAQRTQLQVLYQKYLTADTLAADTLGATTITVDPTTVVQQVTVVAGDVLKFVQSLTPPPTPKAGP